jgi:hypothetical protein
VARDSVEDQTGHSWERWGSASWIWYGAYCGLIHSRPGADKRIRIVSITSKGRKLIEDAQPKWRQAQEALIESIGEDRWRAMRGLLRETTRMVRHRTGTPIAAG